MLTEREVEVLKQKIAMAYLDSDLNGYELGQLDRQHEKLIRDGTNANISPKERAELDRIFIKSGSQSHR